MVEYITKLDMALKQGVNVVMVLIINVYRVTVLVSIDLSQLTMHDIIISNR